MLFFCCCVNFCRIIISYQNFFSNINYLCLLTPQKRYAHAIRIVTKIFYQILIFTHFLKIPQYFDRGTTQKLISWYVNENFYFLIIRKNRFSSKNIVPFSKKYTKRLKLSCSPPTYAYTNYLHSSLDPHLHYHFSIQCRKTRAKSLVFSQICG